MSAPGAPRAPRAVVVMGVSGCGKSTVARALALRLGWRYVDADDHHPPENVAKMRGGTPLTDEDRRPWLDRLHDLLQEGIESDEPLVLACSALKRRYRERLGTSDPRIALVYLRGAPELIEERLRSRRDHYFDVSLLQSQLDALEEPDDALTLDVAEAPEALVERIAAELGLRPVRPADPAPDPGADSADDPADPHPEETP